ncbi:phage tail protein [Sphingomonas immobilis]|uniref:Phage tail protein n=1 Tax=Sphingomonas immobilis TaxID=3063997 RepID=A0ABT9A341_9SPHN|nr:phage tail protein [Sphingomonas sp. CA1-15]MDO7843754.1 phage tail protein [Sphingomonas sp. CA1-15]
MATLVLTTIGGLFGPVGAAIGAIAGQAIDRDVLFKPPGRQGPRLTELAVQVSSYGTPIQKVFGTMRVAGCVIWSTDLIESRDTQSTGKGQPTLTSYSYAASFAVALSGRPVSGVGRIWADGKLLRGAAGDFKVSCVFRLHQGGEDQAADPLIASAEGAGLAPAHRGLAYAVFETLQLADYGNRIPSLTFEVIGDAGPVAAGAIADELSGGAIDGADAALPLPGFAAYGDSVRAVAETLGQAAGAWFVPVGGGLAMRATAAAEREIADDGVAEGADHGARGRRSAAAIETVPHALSLSYYDPARDYQTGVQRARRPGAGTRETRIEMPAVLGADAAKAMAEGALARAEAARERRTVTLGWDALGVSPGACVTIAGVRGTWRVSGWSLEKMVLSLECVRLPVSSPALPASPGRVVSAPDRLAGATILHAFEIPPLGDETLAAPRLTVAAAGTAPGWRRAALLYSVDDGERWVAAGATAAPAVIGTIVSLPIATGAALIDRRSVVEVELAHAGMALSGADGRALDMGANVALLGEELIQFGAATQVAARRWRLSTLWRGRRGTEGAIGTQAVGDRFVLLSADASVAIDLPLSALGRAVRVIASGIGDTGGPVSVTAGMTGLSVLPPAPVGLRAVELGGGDVFLRWTRRSRAGWRWIDGVDAPLAEEREAYRLTIESGGVARIVETSAPEWTVTAAERGTGLRVTVRQTGAAGESPAAEINIGHWEG